MEFERQHIPKSSLPRHVIAKWSERVLDEGYTPFPKRLLRCLSEIFRGEDAVDEIRVCLAMADYLRPNLAHHPSTYYLAFTAGLDSDRFRSVAERLAIRQLIKFDGEDVERFIGLDGLCNRVLELTRSEV